MRFPEIPLEAAFEEIDQSEEILGEFEWERQTYRSTPRSEESTYWQGEITQEGPQRVCWIQESLNRVMGLQLPVDGIMGPQTRSAIRSFQQRQRLSVDGIVGSATFGALLRAGVKPPAQGVFPTDVTAPADASLDQFDFDKSVLKPAHLQAIDSISNKIVESWKRGRPFFTVKVVGHTDPVGQAQYNQALGLRRALAVRTALQNMLKTKQRDLYFKVLVLASSKGASEPVDITNTPQGKARNRRVEVFLSTTALLPLPSPPPPPKVDPDIPVTLIPPEMPPPPVSPDPPGCDATLYADLKRRCYNQALSTVGSCAKTFVVNSGPVLAAAGTILADVMSGAVLTPLGAILALLKAPDLFIKGPQNQFAMAKCIFDSAVRLRDCLDQARRDTNCL